MWSGNLSVAANLPCLRRGGPLVHNHDQECGTTGAWQHGQCIVPLHYLTIYSSDSSILYLTMHHTKHLCDQPALHFLQPESCHANLLHTSPEHEAGSTATELHFSLRIGNSRPHNGVNYECSWICMGVLVAPVSAVLSCHSLVPHPVAPDRFVWLSSPSSV